MRYDLERFNSINCQAIAGMTNVSGFSNVSCFLGNVFDRVSDTFNTLRNGNEIDDVPRPHHLLPDEIRKFVLQSTRFFG
jgi:hypothetical protein